MEKQKIRALNRRHSMAVNKLFPKELGVSSTLLDFDDEIIKLVIRVPQTWELDSHATALQFGIVWRRQHYELRWAKRVAAALHYVDPRGNDLGLVYGTCWFDTNENQPPAVKVSHRLRLETIRRFREQRN